MLPDERTVPARVGPRALPVECVDLGQKPCRLGRGSERT